ncbi:SET domain-containing protein [Mycena floridula]|nr:SET domain-containing protein [Mycena floridula]
MDAEELNNFLTWFKTFGVIDDSVGFTVFSEGGRGAVARQSIEEGQTLFSIPRSLTLSCETSGLPNLFGRDAWKERTLDEGWVGLILCLMYETAQGPSSKWAEYLSILPTHFDTPMFWEDSDLDELKGTSVVVKLGKSEAAQAYEEKLLPAVHSRPDLFSAELIPVYYSLEQYHIMGSRILSRSFHVESWGAKNSDNKIPSSDSAAMDVDEPPEDKENLDATSDDDDDEDEDGEDTAHISMVPVADMLNARFGSENAKLFYEESCLKMVATKKIHAGEQIWNTYGDLPNAELLRRYGHVDLLELPDGSKGNPGDEVEIRADLVTSCLDSVAAEVVQERIDWWLEEGEDDILIIDSSLEVPSALISLTRLLLMDAADWQKARDASKLPKPKLDDQVSRIIKQVLDKRLAEYPTILQVDEQLLAKPLALNMRHSVIVRLGEKRLLKGCIEKLAELEAKKSVKSNNKRKAESQEQNVDVKKGRR